MPERLRAEAHRLVEEAKRSRDATVRQRLAARALELAQQAEAIASLPDDTEGLRVVVSRYTRRIETADHPAATRVLSEVLQHAEHRLERISDSRAPHHAQRAVQDAEIAQITNELYSELDPKKRTTLRRRLVKEENTFGERSLRLEVVQRHIDESAERIERQRALIGNLEANGHDTGDAKKLLPRLVKLHRQFRAYAELLTQALDGARL